MFEINIWILEIKTGVWFPLNSTTWKNRIWKVKRKSFFIYSNEEKELRFNLFNKCHLKMYGRVLQTVYKNSEICFFSFPKNSSFNRHNFLSIVYWAIYNQFRILQKKTVPVVSTKFYVVMVNVKKLKPNVYRIKNLLLNVW